MNSTRQTSTRPAPFWLFDRERLVLMRADGHGELDVRELRTTSDILAELLCLGTTEHPLPAGAYDDLITALQDLMGPVLERVILNDSEEVLVVKDILGVDDLEAYLRICAIPTSRLLVRN